MAKKTVPKKIKKEVEEFVGRLREEKLPIRSVYIFGSFAKGNANKWSDIDVCIVSPKFNNPWKAKRYLWNYLAPIRDPHQPVIEPVGYHPRDFQEGSMLIDEIRQTGIRIL
ncbi:MAG: nucleotidyltransferase domain-containing protein [Patescibacteria group bacterium]